MKLILLWSPWVGKGTIAKLLTKYYNSVQISTWDILRKEVKNGTQLWIEVKKYIDKWDLVPDNIIEKIIKSKFLKLDFTKWFLLDGFPRTINQAKKLKTILEKQKISLDFVINLQTNKEIILERLINRRTCVNEKCQAIFNLKSIDMLPNIDNTCTKCWSLVAQRSDETIDTINFRLETYQKKTVPLIEFYEKEGILKNINFLNSDDVMSSIINLYKNKLVDFRTNEIV
jgi:adenylate kinase